MTTSDAKGRVPVVGDLYRDKAGSIYEVIEVTDKTVSTKLIEESRNHHRYIRRPVGYVFTDLLAKFGHMTLLEPTPSPSDEQMAEWNLR